MSDCRHINWHVEAEDTFGVVTCKDCGEKLNMPIAINSTMEYVYALIKELEALISTPLKEPRKPGRPKANG